MTVERILTEIDPRWIVEIQHRRTELERGETIAVP
jgi:hypothetical protein